MHPAGNRNPPLKYSAAALKARNPLTAVVVAYGVQLSGQGRYRRAHCPFHADRTPSFVVDTATDRWRCFGRCDASSGRWRDAIDFVGWSQHGRRWDSRNRFMFRRALETLDRGTSGHAPTPPPRSPHPLPHAPSRDARMLLDRIATLYEAALWTHAGQNARAYLHGRGFTTPTMRTARLGYAAGQQVHQYLRATGAPATLAHEINLLAPARRREFLAGRIVFPDLNAAGLVVHLVGRTWTNSTRSPRSAPKYLSMKGLPKPLFGWQRVARGSGMLCVTESLTDWLTLLQWGCPAVATLGTALRPDYARQLATCARRLVFLPHNDASGAGLAAVRAWRAAVGRGAVLQLPATLAGRRPIGDVNDLAQLPGGRVMFLRLLRSL